MEAPPVSGTHVHVWTASLIAEATPLAEHSDMLAADEQARADRFRAPYLRRRYVVARGILRRLLAGYLKADARQLSFAYGAHDKPHVANESRLHFNLAHADDCAIYAVAQGREVGIDIEATARDVDVLGVARQAFSSVECAVLTALAPDARQDAFFRIWTRKEAYVKARGEGLSYPTRSFSVSHLADEDALLDDDKDEKARDRWRVIGLEAPPGFSAALCAEGRDWSVQYFDATPFSLATRRPDIV